MPDASISTHAARPIIVFGAFDRHNFGDMLFAHVVDRLLHEHRMDVLPVFAGLAARDMRGYGGHDVVALATLAASLRYAPVSVIHAGGEVLTCDAWEAAVMLSRPDDAQACIARYGAWVTTAARGRARRSAPTRSRRISLATRRSRRRRRSAATRLAA
ncbi:hypothetical protein [Caballeronia sp. RCC_10]|uniref:hypothetical protein n=1 Tax=Caballeronia sp. RCC_10 TaxID=3239227 RepID=UPI003525C7B6